MNEILKSSGNVYADLGLPNADEMLVKAKLASKIREIIESRGWNQIEAAQVLGLPQPKLSNLLRGNFRGISQAKMVECLTRLGRDVKIVIAKQSKKAAMGRVEVVSA